MAQELSKESTILGRSTGDILKYGSKCLMELQITPNGNRRLILKKHRSIGEEKEILFKIVDGGVIGTTESRGFKLF